MGTTTCSTVQIDSKPADSAVDANAAAAAGSVIGPVLAKAIPKRIAGRYRTAVLTPTGHSSIFRH